VGSFSILPIGTYAASANFHQLRDTTLAPQIRINGIGPGETLPSFHQTEQSFERMCATMPLGRGTTPEEICEAVRFILGARAMTGQMIVLDGGQHLGWLLPGQDDAMAAN
jgi:NAD(P)-dependent dehydrogenase (short-subunit alcohol dehydrogenase family)